jgi:indole-3-glycerol phosphate synthase
MTAGALDLLETIVAATRCTVRARRSRVPMTEVERRAANARRGMSTLADALGEHAPIAVIAECKRRSPSRGVLRAAYDPVAIARSYQAAGAAAISVLTEPSFFDGSLGHLAAVRESVDLPLVRKDFVVDEYQIVEARAAGADAVLLIAAALDEHTLARLHACARDLGLDVLVEVHERGELARAVGAGARIIGANHRNLRTLEMDVRLSEALAADLPAGVLLVAESGLKTGEDLQRLSRLGYRAFLVGEHLMASPDPGEALRSLLAGTV